MKKEIADKWIVALNSNEFNQHRGALHNPSNNGYCCLGVLCEIYRKETGKGRWEYDGFMSNPDEKEARLMDWSCQHLPYAVQEWSGMKSPLGQYDEKDNSIETNKNLVYLNDMAGFKFSGIASFIERNWEKL